MAGTVWILEGSAAEAGVIQNAVGSDYELRLFALLRDVRHALDDSGKSTGTQPDLLLTDLYLADGNLLEFFEDGKLTLPPVMIISSAGATSTIVRCLKWGVVDYFIKPVNPGLLCAKVQRFFEHKWRDELKDKLGLQFDRFSLEVRTKKSAVALTLKEFQILSIVYQAFPEGVSRDVLVRHIWKQVKVVSKSFDVHLFHLRQKLETLGFEIRFRDKMMYFLVPPKTK